MRAAVSSDGGTNVFYLDVKAFLEGVEVPLAGVNLSYGVNEVPQASITIPASNVVRDLPETCKVHIFFKDILPDPKTNEYEWRLLFDGELAGMSYSTNPNGAAATISAIHSAGYMSLMQIMTLELSAMLSDPTIGANIIGDAIIPASLGNVRSKSKVIELLSKNKKSFASIADIVYVLAKNVISEVSNSSVGQYYSSKLGNDKGGLKLLNRIFGVSEAATKVSAATGTPSGARGTINPR